MTDSFPHFIVHTDGACSGNPGPGGWALEAKRAGSNFGAETRSGHEPSSTNQRMELIAATKAIELFTYEQLANVTIISDSQYVVEGIKTWLPNWKANNWRTSARKPVANADLWQPLDALLQQREQLGLSLDLEWVKGHADSAANNRVDALAVEASKGRTVGATRVTRKKVRVTLEFDLETESGEPITDLESLQSAAGAAESAIRNRLFGEGFLPHDALIGRYDVSAAVVDGAVAPATGVK